MRNYLLAFVLALLVVLTGMTLRRSVVGIGGAPVPLPPSGVVHIGGAPVPLPPSGEVHIGGAPVPLPPSGVR
jgi:hypothetical protein